MFPVIKNITDVLPAIEGRKEFIVVEKPEGYTYIDYVYVDNDSFDDPIRKECRGLIFDTATGKILRRPLEKFYNYGERFSQDNCDWSKYHIVTDKRDGSMIGSFVLNDRVRFGTRAGITEHAINAERHLLNEVYDRCSDLYVLGFTPIFEWTSPINRIVLNYKEDELSLLRIRHIETGNYMMWEDVQYWASQMKIKTAEHFPNVQISEEWIEDKKKSGTGIEGFVVYWPHSQYSVKIKVDEYTTMHRAISFLDRESMMLPVVLDNLYDDILPSLSEDNQKKVLDYAGEVHKALAEIVESLEADLAQVTKLFDDRKSQALWIQEHIKREYWPVMFHGLDGTDILENVKKAVLKKPELLGVRWN